jgi:hypothetical protein
MIKLQLYFNMIGWIFIFITWGMQLKSNQSDNFKKIEKSLTYLGLICFIISILIYFLN